MISKKFLKKLTSLTLVAAMTIMTAVPAFAGTDTDGVSGGLIYEAPTSPMTVDDNIVTATAHRAASPILGILGVNATSGFGMINGTAPSTLDDAKTRVALGIWGTKINSNPDPYYWNYFYNFYASENNLTLSDDALINDAVSASPMQADLNLQEKYGNVSVSLATRPDIAVGCAAKGADSDDTSGYDDQIETINNFAKDSPYYQEGDETYSPKLVSYQTTTIKEMIQSVHELADAITEVEKETGKTTRYEDVQDIAYDYEKYVYGIISYVREELASKGEEQKKIAVVTAINNDGTYTIANSESRASTSKMRPYEYSMTVTKNIYDDIQSTTATKEQVLAADAIITFSTGKNKTIDKSSLEESFGEDTYDGIIISNTPSCMYGMTMNSVENAMGYAFVIGCLYADTIDINPVQLCAYFYEHFCHVTDKSGLQTVIDTNFASTIMPASVSTDLSKYSSAKIEAMLDTGLDYYKENKSEFTEDEECVQIGLDEWNTTEPTHSSGGGGSSSKDDDDDDDDSYSTSGGSSSGSSSGSSGGSSSSSKNDTTSTTTNSDGSTTTTTTKADGSKVETTTSTDGTKATVTTSTDASGATTVKTEVAVSTKAVENAQKENKAVTLPVEVKATTDTKTASSVEVNIPASAGKVSVEVPVTNVNDGTVAVLVKADGTEEIIPTTLPTTNGVKVSLSGDSTVKIIDNSKTFSDTANHWSKDEVNFVASREIFKGVDGGSFDVSGSMTRGMVNTVLARLSGADTEGGTTWYTKGNEWAVANGISDGTNPTGDVTREQLATMLYRYAGSPEVSGILSFNDANSVSSYAEKAMVWANQIGIIGGMGDGTIAPTAGAQRAQVAAMLARYIKTLSA